MQTGSPWQKYWPLAWGSFLVLALCLLPGSARSASAQISRLPVPDTTRGNYFGAAVALTQDLLLVGSSGDSTCGANAGAAFLYHRLPQDQWEFLARLEPDECGPEEYFGKAVALEAGLAVVTSFVPSFRSVRSNAVYVFEPDEDGQWHQTGKLLAPGNREDGAFASAISLSDGRILVTSAGDTAGGTLRSLTGIRPYGWANSQLAIDEGDGIYRVSIDNVSHGAGEVAVIEIRVDNDTSFEINSSNLTTLFATNGC